LAIPLLLGLLVYANAVTCGFTNWDDPPLVLECEEIRSLDLQAIIRFFSAPVGTAYLPLRTLSYAVDHALWGYSAWAFHATNVLLHLCNVCLAFALARRLTGRPLAACLAAIVFAVHPLLTEGVTWVSGRKEALCGVFYFSSVLAYMRCTTGRVRSYVACAAAMICAILSKGTAVSLPLVFMAYDVCARSDVWRMKPRRRVAHYALFWAIALVFVAVHIGVASEADAVKDYKGHSLGANLLTTAGAFAHYVRLILLPRWLCCRYHFMAVTDPLTPSVWLGVAVLVALIVYIVVAARGGSMIGFGLSWFIASFLPVSNLMPLSVPIAERYMYLPLFGLALAVGVWVSRHAASIRRAAPCLAAVVALWCSGAIARNADWDGAYPLWHGVARQFPMCATAWKNLADAELRCDRPYRHRKAFIRSREALAAVLRAQAESSPNDPEMWARVGRVLSRPPLRRPDEAIDAFRRALAIDPNFASAHHNLAVLYASMSPPRVALAKHHYARSVEAGRPPQSAFTRYLDSLDTRERRP